MNCRYPGCSVDVPEHGFVCATHWKSLPPALRMRIRDAADNPRFEPRAESEFAMWLSNTFGAERDRDSRGRWERLVRFVRTRDAARGQAAAADPPAPRPPAQLRLVP